MTKTCIFCIIRTLYLDSSVAIVLTVASNNQSCIDNISTFKPVMSVH